MLGRRESGTAILEEAIAANRMASNEFARKRRLVDWANLEGGKMGKAIAAFREALKEFTRERVPLDWTATHWRIDLAKSFRVRLLCAEGQFYHTAQDFRPATP